MKKVVCDFCNKTIFTYYKIKNDNCLICTKCAKKAGGVNNINQFLDTKETILEKMKNNYSYPYLKNNNKNILKNQENDSNYFLSPIHIIIMIILLFFTAGIGSLVYYLIYSSLYFKSKYFFNIKNRIQKNTDKCNDLNNHIEELKSAYINFHQIDYGNAKYVDNSSYNYKRPELKKIKNSKNIYNCSLTVCRNAQQQPFKYICKYFNIKQNEESLEQFEKILNDFSAAEQGKELLKMERTKIISNIRIELPFLIKTFSSENTLAKKLGFNQIDFSQLYFPMFIFQYVSAGGNSSMSCKITFDIQNLDRFVTYLSQVVKFKKSVQGQRALMTTTLREKIKKRDNYTCQNCKNSIFIEPNLLLEIDHIKPLSKGGITSEENLQTLCWKCNRNKGNKYNE